MNRHDGFEYTYTSLGESGRREVERLMADYRTSDDLARLRMLDFKARRLPALVATLMGTARALALAGGIAMVADALRRPRRVARGGGRVRVCGGVPRVRPRAETRQGEVRRGDLATDG